MDGTGPQAATQACSDLVRRDQGSSTWALCSGADPLSHYARQGLCQAKAFRL